MLKALTLLSEKVSISGRANGLWSRINGSHLGQFAAILFWDQLCCL